MSAKAPLAYRLLLLLLPPPFRRDFGADLEAVLIQRLRDAAGAAACAWIWLIAVVDVLDERARRVGQTIRQSRWRPFDADDRARPCAVTGVSVARRGTQPDVHMRADATDQLPEGAIES